MFPIIVTQLPTQDHPDRETLPDSIRETGGVGGFPPPHAPLDPPPPPPPGDPGELGAAFRAVSLPIGSPILIAMGVFLSRKRLSKSHIQ